MIILGFVGLLAVVFLIFGISALVVVSQSDKEHQGFLLGASIGVFFFVLLITANIILTVSLEFIDLHLRYLVGISCR